MKRFLPTVKGLSHSHAPAYKIRLFALSSEISLHIFNKIHNENAEFGSLCSKETDAGPAPYPKNVLR